MGTSDRLYELSCECRDQEEALDRIKREIQTLEAIKRAALELIDVVEDDRLSGVMLPLSDRVANALAGLKAVT